MFGGRGKSNELGHIIDLEKCGIRMVDIEFMFLALRLP